MEIIPIAIVSGLVEVTKRAGLSSRWAGLLAVLYGVVVATVQAQDLQLLMGVVYGLIAAGAYSATKSLVK